MNSHVEQTLEKRKSAINEYNERFTRGVTEGHVEDQKRLPLHVLAAILTLGFFQFVDGFDAVTLGLTISSIRKEWPIPVGVLGALLSTAQFGAIGGAMIVGPLCDAFGIKRLLIAVAALMTAGSLLGLVAHGNGLLLASRIVTGVGLGAALPLTVGYISRSVPKRLRPTILVSVVAGLALGQAAGGVLTGPIVGHYGWRGVFWLATILGGLATVALMTIRSEKRLPDIEPAAPEAAVEQIFGSRILHLWRLGYRKQLFAVTQVAVVGSLVYYFLLNWMPILLEQMGLSLRSAALSATCFSIGGLMGSFVIAPLMGRKNPFYVDGSVYVIGGLLLGLMALPWIPAPVTLAICALVGLSFFGAYYAFSVFASSIFPVRTHVHIMGLITIATKSGGLLGPLLAGALLADGHSANFLFSLTSVALILVGILTILIGHVITREHRAREPDRLGQA